MRYIRTQEDEGSCAPRARTPAGRSASYASLLRHEITARAAAWAASRGIPYVCTTGQSRAVLFSAEGAGDHGNFFPASYRRIQANAQWRARLEKAHTSARRFTVTHDADRRELDAATSSDALLMSLFCHPQALSGTRSALGRLLGVGAAAQLDFGYKPRVPWATPHIERTEVDLRVANDAGELLLEAKLTEADFQTIPRSRLLRYIGAVRREESEAAFDLDALPAADESGTRLLHGQLLRGVLSAHAVPGRRYGLICDARRPDLIESWFAVLRAVVSAELRSRLLLVTWQEVIATMPGTVQDWAAAKYGILPAA